MQFLPHRKNSKKFWKKYKIWSPRCFQYKDQIQRFGSVIFILWSCKKMREAKISLASWSTIASLYIYIYIYGASLWYLIKYDQNGTWSLFLQCKSSNDRSEPLNMIFILKSPCRTNFIFFWICLLFFSKILKMVILDCSEEIRLTNLIRL